MATTTRQPANHVQQAKAPASVEVCAGDCPQPVDAPQQAIGNQAVQRLLRAPGLGRLRRRRRSRPDLERNLDAQAGGGEPLSREERSFFEPRFGRDLGGVRRATAISRRHLRRGM